MDKKVSNGGNKKILYFFGGCIALSLMIVGATFAYFIAGVTNSNTISGGTYTSNFSLGVEKVTTVDMAYGLIPMKNVESVRAGHTLCRDNLGNAGCQIYRFTLKTDSTEAMFVDGYLVLTNKEGVETRLTRVYPKTVVDDETGEERTIYTTFYKEEDFSDDSFDEAFYIKDGQVTLEENQRIENLNHSDNSNCLFAENVEIGGDKSIVEVYAMIWVFDNGTNQNLLQGMQLAYNGLAVFNSAEGNEIKATFD